MLNKQKIKRSFSKHAFEYDRWADFQRQVGEKLLIQLDNSFQNILDIGCGTGYFLKNLSEKYPQARLAGLDMAPEMIVQSQKRLGNKAAQWIEADMDEYVYGPERFDLIFSNMTLQWSENLGDLLKRLALSLKTNGELHFSILGEHTLLELRGLFLQHFPGHEQMLHPFLSPNAIREALSSANFQSIFWSEELIAREYDSAKQLLQSLKHLGAGAGTSEKLPIHPHTFMEFLKNYDKSYRTKSEKVTATYEVFHIRAIK